MNSENTVAVANKVGSPILCVIDFSEASKEALRTAINIAGSTRAELKVLYPYRLNQPRNISDVSLWKKNIESDATNNFSRMTNTLLKGSNVPCEFKAEVGFVDDRVEVYTDKHDVGLIVISSDLAYKSDGAFLDMMEKLKSPLLVVPNKRTQEL
jgi:nucleotide-binding universal stress UspA family protein